MYQKLEFKMLCKKNLTFVLCRRSPSKLLYWVLSETKLNTLQILDSMQLKWQLAISGNFCSFYPYTCWTFFLQRFYPVVNFFLFLLCLCIGILNIFFVPNFTLLFTFCVFFIFNFLWFRFFLSLSLFFLFCRVVQGSKAPKQATTIKFSIISFRKNEFIVLNVNKCRIKWL